MDEVEGVVAESPAAPTGAEPSAGTQITGSPGAGQPIPVVEKDPPFHTHPRFRQLVAENNAMKSEMAQQRAWRQQQATAQQPQTPTDPELSAAGQALERVMAAHPKLRALLDADKHFGAVTQMQQHLQTLTDSQQRGLVNTGQSEIGALAKAASLPMSDKAVAAYERLVTAEILNDPDLHERWRRGDISVIREAFPAAVSAFVTEVRRGEVSATAATKNALSKLPPRPSGGAPGAPTPQPFAVKSGEDTRGATSRLHKMARDLGAALQG